MSAPIVTSLIVTAAWLRSACSDDAPATQRSVSVGPEPTVLRITCPECHGDDEPICSCCSGSGEGMWDGSRCSTCRGKGSVHIDCETCDGEGEVDASCRDCGDPATHTVLGRHYCAECSTCAASDGDEPDDLAMAESEER
jgi:hypothetical protein